MIITAPELSAIRNKHKDKMIVLGGGVFDLLHVGHLEYIEELKKHGDIVVILVKPDERVRKLKAANRPIISEIDRVMLVDALRGVDYAFVGPDIPSEKGPNDAMFNAVLAALNPDVFYSTNPVWKQLEGEVATKVVIGDRPSGSISTTKIIERITRRFL